MLVELTCTRHNYCFIGCLWSEDLSETYNSCHIHRWLITDSWCRAAHIIVIIAAHIIVIIVVLNGWYSQCKQSCFHGNDQKGMCLSNSTSICMHCACTGKNCRSYLFNHKKQQDRRKNWKVQKALSKEQLRKLYQVQFIGEVNNVELDRTS